MIQSLLRGCGWVHPGLSVSVPTWNISTWNLDMEFEIPRVISLFIIIYKEGCIMNFRQLLSL